MLFHPRTLAVLVVFIVASAQVRAGRLDTVEPPTQAPALVLYDLSGNVHDLRDLAGRVVLVNFWAGWCGPCMEEMPSIQRLANSAGAPGLTILAVNVQESARRVRQITRQLALELPVPLDRSGEVFRAWGGKVFPTSFLVDRAGRLRFLGQGPIEWDSGEALAAVKILLTETPAAE